jgi:hypothetical protein
VSTLLIFIGIITPNLAHANMTFDEARIGNPTLGKEIFADPACLHQQSLDIRKYQADQNAGIETPEDLKILHDMCSVAAAEQPTIFLSITPSDCNNNPFSRQLQQQQYPTQLQPQFRQQPQQNPSGLVQLANQSAVIACINHVLADSISKAAITDSHSS